ncbi:MAG: AAA family ATPase [Brachymonas sp.]|nr:AAA family ATPase [Brachymonas sp.]
MNKSIQNIMNQETNFPKSLNAQTLRERSAHLAHIAAELKQELFGIDDIIDRVIESLRAWYVMPHIISRPVIVCLWGLTGTGKTQLTRRLAQKLGFYDRFVEVQMDGFSNGTSWRSQDSISAMLSESSIEEGEPGILVLDEFQRFRTMTAKGDDAPVKRYQDVWQLLSDGKLPPSLSFLRELEQALAYSQYQAQWEDEPDASDEEAIKKAQKRPFKISPYEAREIQSALKLKDSLQSIMACSPEALQEKILAYKAQSDHWETDYSRLLIIVSGNLDEMYSELASRVEDCDTDADVFHALSRQLSVIDVKKALNQRFRPEQVARLGNTHIIYPSLNQATYLRLIDNVCAGYVRELASSSGYTFALDECVSRGIYANGVFPAQGTRPLFSSVHCILSAPLVNAALWAAEHALPAGSVITVSLDVAGQCLKLSASNGESSIAHRLNVQLDIEHIKRRASNDFRALLAVHEAGHGLAYALLFGHAPQEVKINVASFEGGYNSYMRLKSQSRQNVLDRICVSLSGRAAETLVFGPKECSTGSYGDIKQATEAAAQFVRHYGFGTRLSHTDITREPGDNLNTDVLPTNAEIEALLYAQFNRACDLMRERSGDLLKIVAELMAQGQVAPTRMVQLLGVKLPSEDVLLTPYHEHLAVFVMQKELMDRVRSNIAIEFKQEVNESQSMEDCTTAHH